MMCQIESMELAQDVGIQFAECFLVGHSDRPRETELVLNFLQFKHEAEDLTVASHHIFSENCRQWRQIRYSVV